MPTIRPARLDDIPAISEWTQETFPWGDYIPQVLQRWVEDAAGRVMVGEESGVVVAMARVSMLSSDEAWAQGMRVHPDHRRQGHGVALTEAVSDWARHQGAQVIRLSIEHWNSNAQGQVSKVGFRPVCDWVHAERAIGESSPVPEGNGGKRVPPPERLRTAPSAEAEAAYLSWVAGELGRAARNLFQVGWRWQRLTPDHLVLAARNQNLLEGRPGWAIAEFEDGTYTVDWLETAESDARAMMLAIVDKAAEFAAETLEVMIPDVPWLEREVRRLGFEVHQLTVWARSL